MKIAKLLIIVSISLSSAFAIDYKNYEFGNEDKEIPVIKNKNVGSGGGITKRLYGEKKSSYNMSPMVLEKLKTFKIEKLEAQIECIEDASTKSELNAC